MAHTLNRMLIAVAVAVIGVVIAGTAAYAQTQTCIVINGVKVYVDDNTYLTNPSAGNASFNTATQIPATGPLNQTLTAVAVNANTNNAVLGPINTTLAPVAQPTSTIISNAPPARFPAAVTIRFIARSTFNGITYQSPASNPLVFTNTNVTQILPFNATFTLANDVTFTQVIPAGTGSFTLKAGTTVRL